MREYTLRRRSLMLHTVSASGHPNKRRKLLSKAASNDEEEEAKTLILGVQGPAFVYDKVDLEGAMFPKAEDEEEKEAAQEDGVEQMAVDEEKPATAVEDGKEKESSETAKEEGEEKNSGKVEKLEPEDKSARPIVVEADGGDAYIFTPDKSTATWSVARLSEDTARLASKRKAEDEGGSVSMGCGLTSTAFKFNDREVHIGGVKVGIKAWRWGVMEQVATAA